MENSWPRNPEIDDMDLFGLWHLGGPFSSTTSTRNGGRSANGAGKKEVDLAEVRVFLVELVLGRIGILSRGGVLLWGGSKDSKLFGRRNACFEWRVI